MAENAATFSASTTTSAIPYDLYSAGVANAVLNETNGNIANSARTGPSTASTTSQRYTAITTSTPMNPQISRGRPPMWNWKYELKGATPAPTSITASAAPNIPPDSHLTARANGAPGRTRTRT